MYNGLYTAYLGMRARQRALDATANNIANASTSGFKADRLIYSSIAAAESETAQREAPATTVNTSAGAQPNGQTVGNATDAAKALQARSVGVVAGGATDLSTGAMRETGRALDLAINGEGFLAVQTPRGERYTRAGALTLDQTGQLVTQNGDLVIGDGGPITLPPGEPTIGEDGTISVGKQTVARLKLVRFNDPRAALVKEGSSLFAATGTERPRAATGAGVIQGALETSNVNAVSEMVAMMQNSREFDSLQRSVTLLMNDLGRKVSTELGRL